MKKVLFATSALVLSAGFASAEVALSGDGRMGMIYDGNDVQFSSRARVKFTLTGESDAGLSFGAAFRVDQENYNGNEYRSAARGSAGAIWISGTYGKLSMGDVVSAAEQAIGDLYEVGYTDGSFAGDVEEIAYLTADGVNINQGPNILYEYTINNISLYASASDGSDTDWFTTVGDDVDDELDAESDQVAWSLAGKYEAETWWVGLAYSKHDEAKEIVLGAEAKFNQFSVKGIYADYKNRGNIDIGGSNWSDEVAELNNTANGYEMDKTLGLSAAYQLDAVLIEGFWRRDEFKTDVAAVEDKDFDSFGIGAEYDLGGGAVLAGGIVDTDYLNDTVVDAGIKFKF
ncbi:MAG: porin [Paracoccus sp. (in: a-proteobacteria)]|jgi:outer membrane protein OmpU|uniref:porin n=1 Tax=Paracoccus sp. TaxID=267 RepID=UPI0035B14942